MDKETIKMQLQQAIQTIPYKEAIKSVALFGSYIHNKQNEDSDIDVLIDFSPQFSIGFFKFCTMREYLSDMLGKKIDLVTPQALSRFIRDTILQQAEIVYER